MLILLQFATLFHIPSLFVLKTNWNGGYDIFTVEGGLKYVVLNELKAKKISGKGKRPFRIGTLSIRLSIVPFVPMTSLLLLYCAISLEISVEQQPYPVLFTVTEEGCKAFAPDFPKIQIQAGTMETALMEAKKQIQKALSQFKYPPIPTRQEDIVVQENSVLILLKTA